MAEFPIPAGDLTPHAPPMLLIDEVLSCDRERIRARATVKADGLFFQPGRGLPGYVGFEILAQAIAAYDGWMRVSEGGKPAIGFLLGCRKYQCAVDWFAAGDELQIEARSLIHEGEMRSFDCKLTGAGGTVLASGVLNVYRPNDPEAFFRRGGSTV